MPGTFDLVPVLSERVVQVSQPIRQLFGIAAHHFTKLIHCSLVPRKPTNSVIRAIERNIPEKFDTIGVLVLIWLHSVLPIRDGRFSIADDLRDFSLEETEIHAPFADVVTDGHGIGWVAGEGLFFEGNFD